MAEGAGQELFDDSLKETDLSGNVTLKDIGLLLKEHIEKHSKNRSLNLKFKYIDPSYMIRGLRLIPRTPLIAYVLLKMLFMPQWRERLEWQLHAGMDITCMCQSSLPSQPASRLTLKAISGTP